MTSRELLRDAIRTLAEVGLSISDAAFVLGMTRGQIASHARQAEIHFNAEQRTGGGCNSEQARRGWETRRQAGWEAPRRQHQVTHLKRA